MKFFYTKLKVLLVTGTLLMLTVMAFSQSDTIIVKGTTLTINPGETKTYGTLTNNGTIYIKSDVTGTGSLIVASTITPVDADSVVIVERYVPNSNWYIVSCPVAKQDIEDFITNNPISTDDNGQYAIAMYLTAQDKWHYALDTDFPFDAVKGYGYTIKRTDVSGAGVLTFSGDSIYTGDISATTSTGGSQWRSIGNPYTSAIWVKNAPNPAEDFITKNDANLATDYKALYIWDQSLNGGDYTVISVANIDFPDGDGGTFGPLIDQDKIAVGQGFIIKAKFTTHVDFTSAMQVHASNTEAPFKSAEKSTPAIRLTVTSGDLANRTIVSFDQESTLGLDPGYDVGKLKGNSNMALFTQLVDGSSDVDFINQSVPNVNYELLTIPVGLDLADAGDITFSLETSIGFPSNMKVYLEDKVLNVTTQLNSKGTIYFASVPSLKGYGRFNLHFSNTTTGIDLEKQNQTNFNVFTRDRQIFVNGPADKNTRLSVYGIDGKIWYQNRAEATNQNTINASDFAAGVYLVKIEKQSGSQIVKVVITE